MQLFDDRSRFENLPVEADSPESAVFGQHSAVRGIAAGIDPFLPRFVRPVRPVRQPRGLPISLPPFFFSKKNGSGRIPDLNCPIPVLKYLQ